MQTQQVRGVATSILTENGETKIVYHNTAVVSFTAGRIILNTGGWRTSTTKTRMNQSAHQFGLGFSVFQKHHDWFVTFNGQTIPFAEQTLTLIRA